MTRVDPDESGTARPRAADHRRGAANNFEALRWIAASAVIVAHAWGLRGLDGLYGRATGLDLGWSAVVIFFTLSGYLICGSAQRRSAADFWKARALRILPGLLVCTTLTALIVFPFSDVDLRTYLSSGQTLKFVFGTGTLLGTEYALPGVFQHNVSTQVNGSLWTLRYEVACYLAVFLIYVATRASRLNFAHAILTAGLACATAHALIVFSGRATPVQITNILSLFFPFAIGAWFQARAKSTPTLFACLGAVALAACFSGTALYTVLAAATISLFTLWVAFRRNRALAAISSLPDYSYGIYIYAYPIQQMIISATPGWHPLQQAIAAFVLTLVPASFSWHFIEKPAMALKSLSLLRRRPSSALT
ncbi:peptidoglycan/LPS O-acetylase OafA/YrhL [Rhodoblastus acidophilus]|uniref:acyltransferase family protein n=1 Tax=Rhodoblastus acidophilus TaxID=1074 RepID=UPI0022255F7D|nr:acyltransferase [Rhodoblastus acidophilus]MCW2284554.1 peptidoglycan/LPS O-acetylase OafA/YrhL [Rhodoblastus acidophilus]MCW2333507.1 peptidoglycan/LPS O-acetylase OafA/YrhL [Rhodoblastus acidophilus]